MIFINQIRHYLDGLKIFKVILPIIRPCNQ